jgi:aryl-alcohol dehydrogenase-like predicted oxidoreductase
VRVDLGARVGLGTAPLGASRDWYIWWGSQDEATAIATIRTAVDAGVTWLDSAPFYGWGRAEELVGRALRGRRHEIRVLTKCCTVRDGQGRSREDGSPEVVRADLEASLRRLGTDYVDVLQVHDVATNVPIEETWGEIQRLIGEGKVRAGGLSNHPVELMDRAESIAPVGVVQHQYSLLRRGVESNDALDWCRSHDVALLAWSPLASGFLTDEFDPSLLEPDDFRHRLEWAAEPRRSEVRHLVERLQAIGSPRGLSATQLAIGWLLAQPPVYPIVGARTPAEARAISHFVEATVDEVAAIEAIPGGSVPDSQPNR